MTRSTTATTFMVVAASGALATIVHCYSRRRYGRRMRLLGLWSEHWEAAVVSIRALYTLLGNESGPSPCLSYAWYQFSRYPRYLCLAVTGIRFARRVPFSRLPTLPKAGLWRNLLGARGSSESPTRRVTPSVTLVVMLPDPD